MTDRYVTGIVSLFLLPFAVGLEPTFDTGDTNVSVVAGQDAKLTCIIQDLGDNQVVWTKGQPTGAMPLTYADSVVMDDTRFKVLRQHSHDWTLKIFETTQSDSGPYYCTVNTDPVKIKKVLLHVKVPPSIDDSASSDDVVTREGDLVILKCIVSGVPRPVVHWYRRPLNNAYADPESKRCTPVIGPGLGDTGEIVMMENITRYCADTYECIASNGVDPSVSREMRVFVEYPPEVRLINDKQWQAVGGQTILQCVVSAYPEGEFYWLFDNELLTSDHSDRHSTEIYRNEYNEVVVRVKIDPIRETDYGLYTCRASNVLGSHAKSMMLHELVRPTTRATPVIVVPVQPHPRPAGEGQVPPGVGGKERKNAVNTGKLESLGSGTTPADSVSLTSLLVSTSAVLLIVTLR